MNTRNKIATLLVVAAAAVGAAFAYAWEPAIAALPAPPPPGGDQALLVRGSHVASTGDCMVCHTTANGKPFAGGLILPLIYGHLSKRHWPARTALG
ncbi:hypothetical protein [Variovorax sp.]|uniref:hypothetical protein n=1 Tax=Variovorax sp. TaxID=1871043 RepID=UPI00137C880D|nr:hypothetical protein [Variovorax sp.]KAF1069220.1 MAG: Nicotinate dehydrogenase subunit B [Variovorax sp.]